MESSKNIKEENKYGSYQSYSEEDEAAEKAVTRDMMLLEYDVDRDVILDAIKKSLRDRNYDEAQEFVYHYRAAAKTDEQFELLARMTQEGIQNKKEAEKIQTVLDATPDGDYEVRLSLSEKLYKLIADDDHLAQVNRYRQLMHKPLIEKKNSALVGQNKVMGKVNEAVRIVGAIMVSITLLMSIAIGAVTLGVFQSWATLIPALAICYHIWSLYRLYKVNHTTKQAIILVGINTIAEFFVMMSLFLAAMMS